VLGVEVRDECAHQTRLADAGRELEAERREVTLEVLKVRKDRLYESQSGRGVGVLRGLEDLERTGQPTERFVLRRAKAQPS